MSLSPKLREQTGQECLLLYKWTKPCRFIVIRERQENSQRGHSIRPNLFFFRPDPEEEPAESKSMSMFMELLFGLGFRGVGWIWVSIWDLLSEEKFGGFWVRAGLLILGEWGMKGC